MKAAFFRTAQADAATPWQHRLTIVLLMLLACLIMLSSSSVVDTARDVYKAWQIASASGFPMEGPHVAAVFHGGPVWFYLLSVPLLLSPSWVLMGLWVGLLTGTKYALAYACGSRLGDRNFGLMWACLLALPNWTSINYLIFSHTNLVETTVLLSFYSLIRWQQGSQRWFFVMCLALGLGIHAHPTVYAAAVLVLPFVILSLWQRRLSAWLLLPGALIAAMPLLPYVISQQLNGWPDLQTSQGYFESQPLWLNLSGFFDVMRGALFDGPVIALRQLLGLSGLLLWSAGALIGLLVLGGVGLTIRAALRQPRDKTAMILLASSLACVACVALIRDVTPFYMTLVIYPPFYAMVAWGWSSGLASFAVPLSRVFAAISLVFLIGFAIATLNMGRQGHVYIPAKSLANVQTHAINEFADGIYFPAWARRQFGEFICGQQLPVYFHGYASLTLEQSYALEAKMRCDTTGVYMGGQGAGQHYIGVSQRDILNLGIAAGTTMGSMDLYDLTQVVEPRMPITIPLGDVYPPRDYYASGEREFTTRFSTDPDEMVVITNLYHFWMPFSFQVSLNGVNVNATYSNMINAFYSCSDCLPGDAQNWSVTINAPKPELVEVVTFTPPRSKP